MPGNDCFFIKTFSKNMRFTGNIVEKNEERCANPIETRKNAHVNEKKKKMAFPHLVLLRINKVREKDCFFWENMGKPWKSVTDQTVLSKSEKNINKLDRQKIML